MEAYCSSATGPAEEVEASGAATVATGWAAGAMAFRSGRSRGGVATTSG